MISAFIKSIRGSDPDGALFWLARMIEAGEDPRFIARRLIVHASEDIGLADSVALVLAIAAAQAVEHVGLPEARLNLAHATIYLATAPKSNSVYTAISRAMEDAPGPSRCRPSARRQLPGAKQLGHGKEYRYPHDFPGIAVEQEYRPTTVPGQALLRAVGPGAWTPRTRSRGRDQAGIRAARTSGSARGVG